MHSAGLWLLLGVASLIIGLAAAPGLVPTGSEKSTAVAAVQDASSTAIKPWPLVALYGLAGFGYVVTATYLPLLVRTALPQLDAAHVWAGFETVFARSEATACRKVLLGIAYDQRLSGLRE